MINSNINYDYWDNNKGKTEIVVMITKTSQNA